VIGFSFTYLLIVDSDDIFYFCTTIYTVAEMNDSLALIPKVIEVAIAVPCHSVAQTVKTLIH
jgi:hypothetical protein